MTLQKIQSDLKEAQLAKEEVKLSTLRLLLSEIHNAEIALRQGTSAMSSVPNGSGQASITDDQVIAVIQREIKKRKEAAAVFKAGGREDLASKEEAEQQILEVYLPRKLSNEELTKLVEDSINEVGAKSLVDMGKVMGVVMGKVAGRADGGMVSTLVKEKLGG